MQTTEQHMTERQFLRILTSSVCGIILCLVGLVGTSWAWYSMEIVSTNNVIQVGQFDVSVTVTASEGTQIEPEGERWTLQPGTYEVHLEPIDSNTPGHCIVMVCGEYLAETAALDPREGGLTFGLIVSQETQWLEILPVLGMPGGDHLLTDGSSITIGETADPPEETTEP